MKIILSLGLDWVRRLKSVLICRWAANDIRRRDPETGDYLDLMGNHLALLLAEPVEPGALHLAFRALRRALRRKHRRWRGPRSGSSN